MEFGRTYSMRRVLTPELVVQVHLIPVLPIHALVYVELVPGGQIVDVWTGYYRRVSAIWGSVASHVEASG